ncbi:unnamed protein product [Rhizoctonia solani]|uniref:Uncharacterized protein n=1 Tax=Rhizoctonia solani TaxID=456999 RepID=A0A8H2WJZ4_9AGAM|nr:unnamed protein product [Rhizoctonia solani]
MVQTHQQACNEPTTPNQTASHMNNTSSNLPTSTKHKQTHHHIGSSARHIDVLPTNTDNKCNDNQPTNTENAQDEYQEETKDAEGVEAADEEEEEGQSDEELQVTKGKQGCPLGSKDWKLWEDRALAEEAFNRKM